MPDRSRRRRATRSVLRGRERALAVGRRLGIALRDARLKAGMTQRALGDAAGLSQGWISRMERGHATSASLESWAAVASVLGLQLVAFLEAVPGASRPIDMEHLRRQELVLRVSAPGGWKGRPEAGVIGPRDALRSVDVLLVREATREAVVNEIWDLLADVGEALRGLDVKLEAVRRLLGRSWRVRGVWVVRARHRNRALVRELSALVDRRFPASGRDWVRALQDPRCQMPDGDGLLWSDAGAIRLFPRR